MFFAFVVLPLVVLVILISILAAFASGMSR